MNIHSELLKHTVDCWVFLFTDDLSKNKVATQTTTHGATSSVEYKYVAGNAVDSDITTCMRTHPIGKLCVDRTVWWRVDLGGVYNIYSVNVKFKNYDGYGIILSISCKIIKSILIFYENLRKIQTIVILYLRLHAHLFYHMLSSVFKLVHRRHFALCLLSVLCILL